MHPLKWLLSLAALGTTGSATAATCDLSYLPIGKATFLISGSGINQTFTLQSQLTYNGVRGTAPEVNATYQWNCVGQELHSLIHMLGVSIHLNKGTYLPAADAWKVGFTWQNEATGQSDDGSITTLATGTNRIVAQEQLRTPAGTFDTFRVEATAQTKPQNTTAKMTFWYAKNYGMVKQVDAQTGLETIMIKFEPLQPAGMTAPGSTPPTKSPKGRR